MNKAIIVHGLVSEEEYFDNKTKSPSKSHWLPWLKDQLIQNGIKAEVLEMPEPWMPNYEKWKTVLDKYSLDENTTLIGHSCGGGFIVRYLSENRVKVGKVVLVAPWIDPDNIEKSIMKDFFNFTIDSSLINKTKGIYILVSKDDDEDILKSVEQIKSKVKNSKVYYFENKGHFTEDDMGTAEFPELLKLVLE